jgi:REP element-mobilizing transposase RayT
MSRRDYKEFAAGEYHHVFNRGNNKSDIFLDGEDYDFFLTRLEEALYPGRGHGAHGHHARSRRRPLPDDAFSLIAYSLMPNHFHLLILQKTDTSISVLMLRLITAYSKYFNKKYERVGTLFQDQFKSSHIEDDAQLIYTSAYIHCNAPVAGLVRSPGDYAYDSYREYVTEGDSVQKIAQPDEIMGHFSGVRKYQEFVAERLEILKCDQIATDGDE